MCKNIVKLNRKYFLAFMVAVSFPLICGLVQAADLKQTVKQLKADMLRIKRLAWTASGKPSENYQRAVAEFGKVVNPKIAAFSKEVNAVPKLSKSLIRAATILKEQSASFSSIFGSSGIIVPPRIERNYQNAVIPALDTINNGLP